MSHPCFSVFFSENWNCPLVQSFRGTAPLDHRRSWFCFCPRSANHCQRFLGLHGMPCGWNDNSSRNRSGRRNPAPSKVNRWWSPRHVDRRANKLIKKPTMGMGQSHSKPSIPDLNIHYQVSRAPMGTIFLPCCSPQPWSQGLAFRRVSTAAAVRSTWWAAVAGPWGICREKSWSIRIQNGWMQWYFHNLCSFGAIFFQGKSIPLVYHGWLPYLRDFFG